MPSTVLITGAAAGIGRAAAHRFAQAQWRCVLVDANAQALDALRSELDPQGRMGHVFQTLDLTDPQQIEALARALPAQQVPVLDALVNNAGMSHAGASALAPLHEGMAARLMALNLAAPARMVQACTPLLRPGARIVNIASGAALHGQANAVGYSASKGAVKLLTQSMAADLGKDGIRVNAVAPGVIVTPMTEATRANPERLERFMGRIPCGRLGQPEEIAGPVVFLASALASYVNGTMLSADGGYSAI